MDIGGIIGAAFAVIIVLILIGTIIPAMFQISGTSGWVFLIGSIALIAGIIMSIIKG